MSLVTEHCLLDHVQHWIRHEGRGHREAHRFANAIQNDPILAYRFRELRLRSQDRPRKHFRPRHRPHAEPYEPHERSDRHDSEPEPEPHEPEPHEPEPEPRPKRRRRSTRQDDEDAG